MPLIFRWPYAVVFWAVMVWSFVPEYRIVKRQTEPLTLPHDAGSKRLIMIVQPIAMLAAFVAPFAVPAAALPNRLTLFWAGVGALVAGSLLRRHCWRMLGASFTGAVIVRADQAVIDRGAYRYVRHPSYTAATILFGGIGLALGNWVSLAVLMAAIAAVYGYRVAAEERALVAVIGEPYVRYMHRTKRFVPFVF